MTLFQLYVAFGATLVILLVAAGTMWFARWLDRRRRLSGR
jgi:virulence-associated protein VagC